MDLRAITEGYSVASQPEPGDMAALAGQGVTTIICNRPDSENPPGLQAADMQAAAEAAGMVFVYNPVVGLGMSAESIERQAEAIDRSEGAVVAYCASGMRSALMWAFANAGRQDSAALLKTVADAGFRMDHLKGQLDGVGATRG